MDRLSSKLRIGEKIALGFGLVCLLFIGVVWHDHQTLQVVLDDYHQLQTVFEVRKSLALEIEFEMAAARDAEKSFLIKHQESFASEFEQHLQTLREKLVALAAVDQDSRQTADEIEGLVMNYQARFHAVADAWRNMGLDENSGLQGAFRQRVHRLQALSVHYNVDELYVVLLQIRRSEKDLALRQEASYRDRVRTLIAEFRRLVQASELQNAVRQKLLAELAVYARTFEVYGESALKAGNVGGGKGSFRDAAHRIEALLDAYRVPNLETNILKLRRHEKDFLLRGDASYPRKVIEIAATIRAQIAGSTIAEADKALVVGLLRDYERDFLALVAQSERVRILTREMDSAADRVAPLVKQNAAQAEQMMAARIDEISASSQASVRRSVIVVACAFALAILFALAITTRIVRPVRQMAGLLDDLAYGTPTRRIPTVPGGRDEINAMAESLNALADHRKNFIDWWKTSMNEMMAQRDLDSAGTHAARDEASRDLQAAAMAKARQLDAIRDRLREQVETVVDVSRRWRVAPRSIDEDDAKSLEHAALGMATLLEVVAVDEKPPNVDRGSPQDTVAG